MAVAVAIVRLQVVSAVLVTHPHVAAFSVGVAQGLARAGDLAGFVTGVAFRDESWSGRLASAVATMRPVVKNRVLEDIPTGRLHGLPAVELGADLAATRRLAESDCASSLTTRSSPLMMPPSP